MRKKSVNCFLSIVTAGITHIRYHIYMHIETFFYPIWSPLVYWWCHWQNYSLTGVFGVHSNQRPQSKALPLSILGILNQSVWTKQLDERRTQPEFLLTNLEKLNCRVGPWSFLEMVEKVVKLSAIVAFYAGDLLRMIRSNAKTVFFCDICKLSF